MSKYAADFRGANRGIVELTFGRTPLHERLIEQLSSLDTGCIEGMPRMLGAPLSPTARLFFTPAWARSGSALARRDDVHEPGLTRLPVLGWADELAELGTDRLLKTRDIVATGEHQFGPHETQKVQKGGDGRASRALKQTFSTSSAAILGVILRISMNADSESD